MLRSIRWRMLSCRATEVVVVLVVIDFGAGMGVGVGVFDAPDPPLWPSQSSRITSGMCSYWSSVFAVWLLSGVPPEFIVSLL